MQIRHGDVLLTSIPRTKLPKEGKFKKSTGEVILAYGEVSGHKHSLADYSGIEVIDGVRGLPDFLSLPATRILDHEEHGPVEVPQGFYQVTIQREYEPEVGQRLVAD